MKADSEEPQIADEAPVVKWRLTIVVALSMLSGILFTVIVVGGFFYYRETRTLRAETFAAKSQLTEKSIALAEMKAEIDALSRQMYALKDYSIARSGRSAEKNKTAENAVAADTATAAPVVETAVATPATASPPKVRKIKPKPDGQSCELVGKSAAEQAATLKRCVTVMDNPKAAPRSP